MKKNISIILLCSLFCVSLQAEVQTIFHCKVIQSAIPPTTADRPENFQQYLGAFAYLEYDFNHKSYYVLFGYPADKRDDAITVLDKIDETSDQIISQW